MPEISEKEANKLLSRTKIQLMRLPNTVFYTTLLFSLKQKFTDRIPTAATNGTHLYINPDFFFKLSDKQKIGLLVHEVMHVALSHMTRRGDRDPRVWNQAGDHVINLSLLDVGYELPANGLHDSQYANMATEQVYKLLLEKAKEEEKNGGTKIEDIEIPGGADIEYPDNPVEIDKIEKEVAKITKKAQMQAIAGNELPGNLPGEMERLLEKALNPKLPWNIILQNYLTNFAKDDYSWRRPNRRYLPNYLPAAYSEAIGEIAIAVDTSGSVEDHEFSYFIAEIATIQETLKPEKITIIDFDSKINSIQEINSMTDLMELKFTGYGGTYVPPVLKWAQSHDPVALLVFTDGCFNLPSEDCYPDSPIIWLIHNNPTFTIPHGEVIYYDIN